MSSTDESRQLLQRYLRARIPFLVVDTVERNKTLDILKDIVNNYPLLTAGQKLDLYVHTLSKGIMKVSNENEISANKDKTLAGALDFLAKEMEGRHKNFAFVFTTPPDLSTCNLETQKILDLVSLAEENECIIIVLTNESIWERLRRTGMIVKVELPNEQERIEIIKSFISRNSSLNYEWDENDIKEAASLLTGLTETEMKNVIGSLVVEAALRPGKILTKEDLKKLQSAKNSLFTNISGLEKITLPFSKAGQNQMGGLSGLQKWLTEKGSLFSSVQKNEELRSRGLRSPRGILLVGVPGCGKSLSAKFIASSWNLPLYRLDFATVQGSYVGQSEQQLKEALTTAENLSPCILWIDEIEKGLSGAKTTNDGGVSKRMVGQFLFWLQECTKQVFVVATANDIDSLPIELLRRGRFDEIFFVDLPTDSERLEILQIYFKKYLKMELDKNFANELLECTKDFSGSDLESSVRDLAYKKLGADDYKLTPDSMLKIFKSVNPLSKIDPARIDAIRDWGRSRALPASGQPIPDKPINVGNSRNMARTLDV
jgi:SpoVK/Ycf46/Vps4 family AAA+-type ATPase